MRSLENIDKALVGGASGISQIWSDIDMSIYFCSIICNLDSECLILIII